MDTQYEHFPSLAESCLFLALGALIIGRGVCFVSFYCCTVLVRPSKCKQSVNSSQQQQRVEVQIIAHILSSSFESFIQSSIEVARDGAMSVKSDWDVPTPRCTAPVDVYAAIRCMIRQLDQLAANPQG